MTVKSFDTVLSH